MSASGVTVREIVANKFDLSVEELSQETSFIQDLDANSLDKVELIMLFEEAFQLEIMDAEAEEIVTVGDAETFIERALNAKR
jgi:acyl carrier protein